MLKNNRVHLCFKYHLSGLSRASLVYLLIFLAVDLVLPAVLYLIIHQRTINSNFDMVFNQGQFGSTTFWLSTMIFLFVGYCASFREDFNHLLSMNTTRRNQFLSLQPLMLVSSLAFTFAGLVIRILEVFVEALVNETVLVHGLQNYWRNFAVDRLAVTGSELLLYLAGFLAVSTFGNLAGVLFYRYGKYVMVPFWICFGCSFVVVPILMTNNQWFSQLIIWFFGLKQSLPELAAGLHLLVLAILLAVLAGFFVRKMPLNA